MTEWKFWTISPKRELTHKLHISLDENKAKLAHIHTKPFEVLSVDEWENLEEVLIDGEGKPIRCWRVAGGLLKCEVGGTITLPNICWIDETGNKVCGWDKLKWWQLDTALHLLRECEKLKPGFNEFLAKNEVTVIFDEFYLKQRGALGLASCWAGDKEIRVDPDASYRTLMHEFAHCKEHIYRRYKKLHPPHGEWKKVDGRRIPVGAEERAVKFAERMSIKRALNVENK